MKERYRLNTRDRPGLLLAMMKALASDVSRISFEGNLSQTELVRLDGVSHEQDDVLTRATLQPQLDFIILPLTLDSVAPITKAVVSKISFSGSKGIIHVQIAKDRQIVFAAYDNFSSDAVIASGVAVPCNLLDELTSTRILHGYKLVNQ